MATQADVTAATAAVKAIQDNFKAFEISWLATNLVLIATEASHYASNPNHASLPADRAAITAHEATHKSTWEAMRLNYYNARKTELQAWLDFTDISRTIWDSLNQDERLAHCKKYTGFNVEFANVVGTYTPKAWDRTKLPGGVEWRQDQ
jgi:hypothetical protein